LVHHKKKLKLWRLPIRFYGKMDSLPLWLNYISERGRILGKTYGIKARCYWEHPWRTHWEPNKNPLELEGYMLGTKENWKKFFPPFHPYTQNLEKIKSRHFECMLSLPISYMKFLFSKTIHHHFWLGLIPPL
jgi:hypothetical protein